MFTNERSRLAHSLSCELGPNGERNAGDGKGERAGHSRSIAERWIAFFVFLSSRAMVLRIGASRSQDKSTLHSQTLTSGLKQRMPFNPCAALQIPRDADSGLTDIVTKQASPGILLALLSALLLDSEPQRRKFCSHSSQRWSESSLI